MSKSFAIISLSLLLFCGVSFAQKATDSLPRVFLLDAKQIFDDRVRLARPDATAADKCAVAKIIRDGDKALKIEITPVTAKPLVAPSGDKHDYMSLAPYFWPDPKKRDGLPYIRRDGERNPEIKSIPDHDSLARLVDTVETLARAYYLSRDEKYSARDATLLRMWFLDAATRMNPNMEYAQAVRGESTGRNFGIIETRGLTRLVDSIGLLAGSKNWSEADQKGLEKWFGGYLDWLLTSKLGKLEAAAKNNHGTHYDEQVASFALFVGRRDLARQIIETAKEERIASQIEPDGSQPLELARTQSWGYSTMNLSGFLSLAKLGESVNVDLWNYTTKDGRGIRKAIEYLAPFAAGKKWEHQVLTPLEPERLNRLIRLAGRKYTDKTFGDLVLKSTDLANLSCTTLFEP
ncbi:MAG: alginate lyase family protein [Acidobacteria bacterium]|nr:alginate lyase family protein [Acidobacteriota bacterium]